MKFLVALTYLLVSALTPNAYADLIRGAKKDDGQLSTKKNWAASKLTEEQLATWAQRASTPQQHDRELAAFKYDCPSFLYPPKGFIPSILITCEYDLSTTFISTIQCELFDRVNLTPIEGGLTGSVFYTYDERLGYNIITVEGNVYLDIVDKTTGLKASEIILPTTILLANGYNPDIRFGRPYLYLLPDKEKCMAKYTRFVLDCDIDNDCGFDETSVFLYGHLE